MSLFKSPYSFFQTPTHPPLDEDEKKHTYFERMLVWIPAAPQNKSWQLSVDKNKIVDNCVLTILQLLYEFKS